MLAPRIYRMALILPALALVVLAFSLTGQPGALHSALAPSALNGANVAQTMATLARDDSGATAGSPADGRIAGLVAGAHGLGADGFTVTRDVFQADTRSGDRQLVNVIATRPGTASSEGAIVVVAPRDLPGRAGLSATAMLLELGRVLGGETLDRTVVLVSSSGSVGAVGAGRLAAHLPQPAAAVLVLGDLASVRRSQPIVVPWTSRATIAPVRLRNTVSAALADQAGLRVSSPDLADQLAHLAFPLTISGQGPFGARGIPAVEVSLSGERGPAAGATVLGAGGLGAVGRGLLSAISALDDGPAIAAPSAYLIVDHEVVPGWAVSLFVLALFVPVALTTIDGVARARRRGHRLGRSLAAVLTAAAPFLAAAAVLVIGGAIGAIGALPGATEPGTIAVSGAAIAVMAVALLAALGAGVLTRSAFLAVGGPSRRREPGATSGSSSPAVGDDGVAAAMLLVLCAVAMLVWLANPFAAALLVVALHLWLWAIDSDLAVPLPVRLVMLVLGLLPAAAVAIFYAHELHLGVGGLAWMGVLLLAGHVVSWVAVAEWSVVLGCLVTGIVLVVVAARRPAPVAPPVTVRGPVGYAGPGSLGGTKSALRR